MQLGASHILHHVRAANVGSHAGGVVVCEASQGMSVNVYQASCGQQVMHEG